MGRIALLVQLTFCLTTAKYVSVTFNAEEKYGVHNYVKSGGSSVVLNCVIMNRGILSDVIIYKGVHPYRSTRLSGQSGGTETYKYDLVVSDRIYNLSIFNLDENDSSPYGCTVCSYIGRKIVCVYDFQYLHVINVTKDVTIEKASEVCDLNGSSDGVIFDEEDLFLICPEDVTLRISHEQMDLQIVPSKEKRQDTYIYSIQNISKSWNGTRLLCEDDDKPGHDYCKDLPNITVYDSFFVKIVPEKKEISNGANITLTCEGNPPFLSSVVWDIAENDIMFGNVTYVPINETTRATELIITNIDGRNSTSLSFKVICNGTLGSRSSVVVATITINLGEGLSSGLIAAIVVSFIILMIIVSALVAVLFYCKSVKLSRSRNASENNKTLQKNSEHEDKNVYKTGNYEVVELSADVNGVVDNVAYVPYLGE